MTPFWKLSAAGFAATAITYGPARMGFGLFLPEFAADFAISPRAAGLISGLGFFGFFAGLLVSQVMTSRRGPRLPIVSGLVAATAGFGVVAAAQSLPILCLGVLLAMSSAGFSWTPFNDAINRNVEDARRPAALSLVSTGTALGIVAGGGAGLLMSLGGVSWRLCWIGFAAAGAVALLANGIGLRDAGRPVPGAGRRWRALLEPAAAPLLAIGLCFGVTSAIYISFAAERIAQAGGVAGLPANASGGLVFICFGAFGLAGLVTAIAKTVMGLAWLLRLLLLASAVSLGLVALAPTSWAGVVLSAGLQGVYVMMMSAIMAFWSERLFPANPSQGFTAVILAAAAGSVIGPVAAGFAFDAFGAAPMFLGTAALSAAMAAVIQARRIRERPDPS